VLQWNPDVYQQSTAEAWLASFAAWARWLAEDPARADLALPALLPSEAVLLQDLENGPQVARPALRCHEIFEDIADRHPERPAVVTHNGALTLAELDAQANRIAASLLLHGIGRDEAVAVLTECSPDLPATDRHLEGGRRLSSAGA
jgi:non-ribosomal peptide synthetase component F